MKISEKGLNLIKEFEGCQLNAYKCPSHVWTIGWGHTGDVYEGQSITQEEADSLLINDMVEYEGYVNNCNNLTFTPNQNQFDALVSFAYNCGNGSLNTLVQNRDSSTVADKLLLYINGSDGVLQGLVRRREAERTLFLNEDCEPCVSETVTILGYGKVTASVLNVRDNPHGEIIGRISKDDIIKIDKDVEGWYSIYFGEHGGYVAKDYVTPLNGIDGVIGTVKASVLNVRDSIDGNVIGQLKQGDTVKLCRQEGNWYHIYYGNSGAWVSADYIEV